MGDITKIQWTDHTFNPWIGCTAVHTGCANCYAEAQNNRYKYNGSGAWGPGATRKITVDQNWKKPLKWARDAARDGVRRRVFCASLADVLDQEAPPEAQARLWDLIRATAFCGVDDKGRLQTFTPTKPDLAMRIGGLDWQLLTKRPERWELIPYDVRPLVWLGTSIANQPTAEIWTRRLREAQGFRLRFLSAEPLVGPISFDKIGLGGIDWVIVGGESGAARPCDITWIGSLVSQLQSAGVPAFVKQLGAKVTDARNGHERLFFHHSKAGDLGEWTGPLRVRQFPEAQR